MKKLLIIAVAAMAIFAMSVPAMAAGPSPSSYTFEMAARMLTDIGWQQQSAEQTRNGETSVGGWFAR